MAEATRLAQQQRPELAIEGPLQYDAAVNPETARTKMKGKETKVAGKVCEGVERKGGCFYHNLVF